MLKGESVMDLLAEITDPKGLSEPTINHVFLGYVENKSDGSTYVSGYHCDKHYSDTKCEIIPNTKMVIDSRLGLYEAVVRDKITKTRKTHNGGKSSFFNEYWSRQNVVDCITNAINHPGRRTRNNRMAYTDPVSGVTVVKLGTTYYPIPTI